MRRYCEVEREKVDVTTLVGEAGTYFGHVNVDPPHTTEGWPLKQTGGIWTLAVESTPGLFTINGPLIDAAEDGDARGKQ